MEEDKNKWEESISENILSLNKKIYLITLIGFFLIITSFMLRCDFSISKDFIKTISEIILLLLIFILINLVKKIKTTRWADIFCLLIIMLFDIILYLEYCKCKEGDNNFYIRMLYFSISFTLIFYNIKPDQTFKKFLCLLIYKLIIFCIFLYNMNFHINILIYFGSDLNMVIVSLAIAVGQIQTKFFFFEKMEKIFNENYILNHKFKNIIPNFKIPIIRIDIYNFDVFHNNSFFNFLNDNFNKEGFEINTFSNPDNKHIEINTNRSLEVLEALDDTEKRFLVEIEKSINNQEKLEKFKYFKHILLILYKILNKFIKESKESDEPSQYLNLFEILQEKQNEICYQHTFKLLLNRRIFEIEFIKYLYIENHSFVQISFNDISEVRKKEMIEEEIKYNKVFLAKLAHEFKTPMNCLIYKVRKFIEKFKELSGKTGSESECVLRYLTKSSKNIESQANFLNILIHDINDFCKDINDLEVCLTSVDIKYLINFSFDILQSLVNIDDSKRNNIKLFLNVDENLPTSIITDEKRLKQLLVNLISNSVKFTNFGHIKLIIKSLPEVCRESPKEFFFEVEDTGIGINEEHQNKLFLEFQSDLNKNFKNLNKEGSGLGLSICKRIIEKLGKDLKCESNTDCTKFSFIIYDFSEKSNKCKETICKTEDGFYWQETKRYSNGFNIMELDSKIFESEGHNDKEVNSLIISPKSYDTRHNDIRIKPSFNLESEYHLNIIKIPHSLKKEEKEKTMDKYSREAGKTEKNLKKLMENGDFSIYKNNYMNFTKSLVKYMKYIMSSSIKFTKFILIVDDERINAKALKQLIKMFFSENRINDINIIIVSDGIECLNILYYDLMFFMRIFLVISDLNMKMLNGDCLYRIITNIHAFHKIKFAMYTNTDSELLKDLGIKYFLKKPCKKSEIEELYNKIRSN